MKMMKTGQTRSDKMADEVLEAKAAEASEEVMVDKSVEQEGKETEDKDAKKTEDAKEKKEDSILINPKKTGKLKIELKPDGSVYITGKNIKDSDELPLFLVTYGINIMLQKDVKPSYIMNGILSYKPFKEKMIIENYEKDNESKNSGSGQSEVSANGINPLLGMMASMMASGASGGEVQEAHAEPVEEAKINAVQEAEINE